MMNSSYFFNAIHLDYHVSVLTTTLDDMKRNAGVRAVRVGAVDGLRLDLDDLLVLVKSADSGAVDAAGCRCCGATR